jgi:hypothetical protein
VLLEDERGKEAIVLRLVINTTACRNATASLAAWSNFI